MTQAGPYICEAQKKLAFGNLTLLISNLWFSRASSSNTVDLQSPTITVWTHTHCNHSQRDRKPFTGNPDWNVITYRLLTLCAHWRGSTSSSTTRNLQLRIYPILGHIWFNSLVIVLLPADASCTSLLKPDWFTDWNTGSRHSMFTSHPHVQDSEPRSATQLSRTSASSSNAKPTQSFTDREPLWLPVDLHFTFILTAETHPLQAFPKEIANQSSSWYILSATI